VVDRQFVLKRKEKEQFVHLMRLYEAFCGVRVLAFCVMSNHFHLLVEVPQRPAEGLCDGEFFARLSLLYSELYVDEVREQIRLRKKAKDWEGVDEVKEKYLYRMWDLSEFMKTLKQRFTQWFNTRHGRRGTLWEDRFKSVIVQDGYAARVMAAYIDLNPVRAGIVKKPEDYRWCSYAEALAGKDAARQGIGRVMREFHKLGGRWRPRGSWRQLIASYRVILFSDGKERIRESALTHEGEAARRGVSAVEAEEVRKSGGKLSGSEILLHRVRHFVEGAAIGSEDFLEEVFLEARSRFGSRRKSGARKIRGCETELRALRDLRGGVG
jgi:REP element-mobilizing transposase RayT